MISSAASLLPLVAFALVSTQAHALRRGEHDRHLMGEDAPSAFQVGDYIWPSVEAFHQDPKARCGTEEPTKAEKVEMIQSVTDFYNQSAHRFLAEETIVVDTYFHIIKDTAGRGATSKMVEDQVAVMNQAFAPHFRFNLLAVTETVNDDWYRVRRLSVQDLTMRATLRQGGAEAINVYTANSRGLDQSMPGGTAVPYNLGMTAVHEIGHSLGILHTFQDGCGATGATGDSIHDTPKQAEATIGCPIGRDSCPGGGEDPIHNYMDYSDDACMNEFTEGQFKQMRAMWYTYRAKVEDRIDDSLAISCTKQGLDRAVCNKKNEQCCGGVCQPCSK